MTRIGTSTVGPTTNEAIHDNFQGMRILQCRSAGRAVPGFLSVAFSGYPPILAYVAPDSLIFELDGALTCLSGRILFAHSSISYVY